MNDFLRQRFVEKLGNSSDTGWQVLKKNEEKQIVSIVKKQNYNDNELIFFLQLLGFWNAKSSAKHVRSSGPDFDIRTPSTDRSEIYNFGIYSSFCYTIKQRKI